MQNMGGGGQTKCIMGEVEAVNMLVRAIGRWHEMVGNWRIKESLFKLGAVSLSVQR